MNYHPYKDYVTVRRFKDPAMCLFRNEPSVWESNFDEYRINVKELIEDIREQRHKQRILDPDCDSPRWLHLGCVLYSALETYLKLDNCYEVEDKGVPSFMGMLILKSKDKFVCRVLN